MSNATNIANANIFSQTPAKTNTTNTNKKEPQNKVFFKTFGCRTNLYDTQVMRENLKDFEIVENEDESNIVVVNSCTVTNGADSGVRNYVRKMSNTGKRVIFAGCGVSTQGKKLFSDNLVSGVLGHSHKEQINAALLLNTRFFYEDNLESKHIDSSLIADFVGKSRAFIKIQEGCDFACSYCIIPFVRGGARSVSTEHIIEQVKRLSEKGIIEVVLSGTNVGSYGKDNNSSLSILIKKLIELPNLKRIRIGSLEPSQINSEMIEVFSHQKFAKHIHIALQYTHNKMLIKMNRQNRVESDFKLLESISKLGFAIGTDFIVGHPGEDKDMWKEAMENLNALPLTHLHPFIYSVRDNTPSALMKPRVLGDVAKDRLHQAKQCVARKNLAFRENQAKHKKPLQILLEKRIGDCHYGLDEFFNKIIIESKADLPKWLIIQSYQTQEDVNYARL